MIDQISGFVREHPTLTGTLFGLSLLMFVGGLIAMPILIARLRPDHFMRPPDESSWLGRHRVARTIGIVAKNLLGVVLLLAGIAMLVLPGQGLITILVALSLLNFPGKQRLELKIVRQRTVRRAIRWIRERARQPPLILPPKNK